MCFKIQYIFINMIIGIYKITSPSGKIYVGQSVNIEKRKIQHNNFNEIKKHPKLFNSVKKYGIETHIFEIIEECIIEQLNEREIYWGTLFNVLGKDGLNLRLGEGRGSCSEETKQKLRKSKPKEQGLKISISKTGHKCYSNPNRGLKISISNKGKPKPEGFGEKIKSCLTGIPKSEEVKNNMRKPHKKYTKRIGKPRGKYNKSI